MDYMGVFVERDPEPEPVRDDGLHCSTCALEKEVDNHECNACSREWGNSGCEIHTRWRTKRSS